MALKRRTLTIFSSCNFLQKEQHFNNLADPKLLHHTLPVCNLSSIKVCYNSFTLYARLSNGYCPSDNSIHHMVWFFGVVLVGIGCFQFRWFGWFQMDLGFFIGYICFEVIVIWYHCVKRAPLLYFIRSWVALSFKVCQSVSE